MKIKILEKTIDKVKKDGLKGDATVSTGWGSGVSFEDKSVKSVQTSQKEGLSLRLINKDNKIGLSGTFNIIDQEIDKVISDSKEVSEYGQEAKFGLPIKVDNKKIPKTSDAGLRKKDIDDLIDEGKKVVNKVNSHKSRMQIESLDISVASNNSAFLNTEGVYAEEDRTMLSYSISTQKVKEGDFFQLFQGGSSTQDDIDFGKEADKLLLKADWGKKVAKIASGKFPVVFVPEGVSVLTDYILRNLSGKFTNEGSSKLKDALGKKIFDERINIVDDATLDYYPGSHVIDDEGVVGGKTTLVKDGKIENFYYDLQQAAKAGKDSTGNGSKGGMFGGVTPGISNIVIGGGDRTYDELIKDIDEGILGYYFLGAGQNNPFNGDFQLSTYVGFKIEKGEIVGRLKDTAISGNVFDLLKNKLLWISKDRERHGNVLAPYVCVDDVIVLSK
jgi:PmbA protein